MATTIRARIEAARRRQAQYVDGASGLGQEADVLAWIEQSAVRSLDALRVGDRLTLVEQMEGYAVDGVWVVSLVERDGFRAVPCILPNVPGVFFTVRELGCFKRNTPQGVPVETDEDRAALAKHAGDVTEEIGRR